MLSSAFLGLSVVWLTTRSAFSWPIWGLLAYLGAIGVIDYLVLGVQNCKWIWYIQSISIRGFLTDLVHSLLLLFGALAVVATADRRGGVTWLICGSSLAAVAVCSWAAVRWADRQGGSSTRAP
jgi:hypothetical protein